MAHGYFAYVNETPFAYPEHLVHGGVALESDTVFLMTAFRFILLSVQIAINIANQYSVLHAGQSSKFINVGFCQKK